MTVRTGIGIAMLTTAILMACTDGGGLTEPTSLAPQFLAPEACAEWSCDGWICGGQEACCVRSIYDPPNSYAEPGTPVEQPYCETGGCSLQDNVCFWVGDTTPGYPFGDPYSGTCHWDGQASCDAMCGENAECRSDPITQDYCLQWTNKADCE